MATVEDLDQNPDLGHNLNDSTIVGNTRAPNYGSVSPSLEKPVPSMAEGAGVKKDPEEFEQVLPLGASTICKHCRLVYSASTSCRCGTSTSATGVLTSQHSASAIPLQADFTRLSIAYATQEQSRLASERLEMKLLEEEWNSYAQSGLIPTYHDPESDLAILDVEQVSEHEKLKESQRAIDRLETKLREDEWNDRVHR